jgi:long-chain fatty acid transport protein
MVVATLSVSMVARGAGYDELPDQGAQALGRGGAFTAKADDATAVYYNVAGLARQRGTKLLVSANVISSALTFTRAGRYPDDPTNPGTPWGGKPFPIVRNTAPPAVLPMAAATTDLGFERLTLGAGVFGPSAVPGRTFPMRVRGAPSPARYDFVASKALIVFPTGAIAYRVTDEIDVGVAAHLVLGEFDASAISYSDAAVGLCKNVEDHRCDSQSRLVASGKSVTGSVGVLVRPTRFLQLGAQVRGPTELHAKGTASSTKPAAAPSGVDLKPGAAELEVDLPWVARVGARYVRMSGDREVFDVELDATYEAWGSAQATGPTVFSPDLGFAKNVTVVSMHHYDDTMSVRAGGAYNLDALGGTVAVRAGAYYDSSATAPAYARVDVDTLAKLAGTVGFGFRTRTVAVNVAYAAVASISREVTDGDIRPSNGAKMGASVDAKGAPLPAVNNGSYSGFNHVLAASVEVDFEQLLK